MANRREKVEAVTDFIFLGSKITVDSDCSHEIKKSFLLGRKAMTKLDNVYKSRDITLLTKVNIVKAMIFLVVLYRCERWTIKKDKHWRTDAFELRCWRILKCLLDCKEIKPVNPKGNQSWILIEGLLLKLKLQYTGHLTQRADSLENTLMLGKIEGKWRRGWQRMRWLDSIIDSMDMSLSNLWKTVEDRGAWHATV